jgi:hypothetical protein
VLALHAQAPALLADGTFRQLISSLALVLMVSPRSG